MRRVKSVVSERKSDRKKLYEKYSDRISTFRVCTNSKGLGSRYSSPPPENANQNNNGARSNQVVESFNNLSFDEPVMPLQESNTVYRSNENQRLQEEQNLLYTLLAMTPVAAFESLPVNNLHNNNGVFSMQTVPNSYPETTLSGFQDQTINNTVDNNINNQMQMNVNANLAAFNQTVPRNTHNSHHQHHHHHHGIDHYSSDPSFLIPAGLMNNYGNHDVAHNNTAVNNLINHQSLPSQSSTIGVTVPLTQTTTPPLQRKPSELVGTPTRPSPPSLPGGPQYFQASEDFRMCFRRVDSDDNGFITLEELRIFLENNDGSRFNDDAVLTIMDMFDNNKDNMIDSSEFPDMLAFIKNWDSCFKFLDKDNSGTIDFKEMIDAIKCLGFNLSHKFALMLLQKYNRSDGGQINLDNFILACVTLCRYKQLYQNMVEMFGSTGPKIDLEQFICLFMWPGTKI